MTHTIHHGNEQEERHATSDQKNNDAWTWVGIWALSFAILTFVSLVVGVAA